MSQATSAFHNEVVSKPPPGRADTPFDEAAVRTFFRFVKGQGDGVVEMRLIRASGGVMGIGFYSDEDAFAKACRTNDGNLQIYGGIQPRPRRFLDRAPNGIQPRSQGGKAEDIETVRMQIIDLDPDRPKGTASTAEQLALSRSVAERIRADAVTRGWPAPPLVMSGNGVHVYFFFPEVHIRDQVHREEVAAGFKAFEAWVQRTYATDGIKIDKISDLPRIIKVPGVMSIKGDNSPERPWRRAHFLTDSTRVENGAFWDFVNTLPAAEKEKKAKATTKDSGTADTEIVFGDQPSERVMKVVFGNKNIKAHWEGRGKPAMNADGTPGDTSRSGYDWTVLLGLIKAGITDPSELATAVFHRPAGAGAEKDKDYVIRTVLKALRVMESHDQNGHAGTINFEVHSATCTNSNPKKFTLATSLGTLELETEDLSTSKKFSEAFLNAFGRYPVGDPLNTQSDWAQLVDSWLEKATVVELPPEASKEFRLKEAVIRAVDNMPEGHDVEDLDSNQYLIIDGRRTFKSKAVERTVNSSLVGSTKVKSHTICDTLRKLGCTEPLPRIGQKRVRVFAVPDQWPVEFTGVDTSASAAPDSDADPRQLCFPFMMEEPVNA
ncbi:MAG: hypothetical protein PHU25_13490 [Deltaproteobacteria bacterium]|nr:hypothetical protein [Deltaproteobacteria bacterium]